MSTATNSAAKTSQMSAFAILAAAPQGPLDDVLSSYTSTSPRAYGVAT